MRKPSVNKLIKRSAIWFDGDELRITLSERENNAAQKGSEFKTNSWWYNPKHDEWVTSIYGYHGMRNSYEFICFVDGKKS